MDLNRLLDMQVDRLNSIGLDEFSLMTEADLYDGINSEHSDLLKVVFTMLHHFFNESFTSLNYCSRKSRQGGKDFHLSAGESRQLIECISIFRDTFKHLSDTDEAFDLDSDYLEQINSVDKYLRSTYGSDIPFESYNELAIEEYEPIFKFSNTLEKSVSGVNHPIRMKLNMIGEGSYAFTYKFKDTFYDKTFVLKRAKKDLNEKEIQRFKQEFELLKGLNSPYLIKVYKMNEHPLEYVMDYGDINLERFIDGNPQLSESDRKKIVAQLLAGFDYIHSKGILHRDISPSNLLLNLYDDNVFVVKICDLGLAKNPDNHLTSIQTDFKGWFNDPALRTKGFSNYQMAHEIYALTTLIFFVMSGRTNLDKVPNDSVKNFIKNGTDSDLNKRYKSIKELKRSFYETLWS